MSAVALHQASSSRLQSLANKEWAWLAGIILLMSAVLTILEPNFLTQFNFYVLLRGIAVTLIVAYAQLMVLVVGQLNLSVGATGGMVAICTGGMMEVWGLPTVIAVALGLLIGVGAGLANGLLTTRTGINGFIKSAALEFAGYGITVNGVEPGNILTEGMKAHRSASFIKSMEDSVPLGRLGTPRDIANAFLYFASDDAEYVTGTTIVVDGGQILPEGADFRLNPD